MKFGRLAQLIRFAKDKRGNVATEAAFAFPVVIAVFLMVVELANIALTVEITESAVNSALIRFRDAGELGPTAENDIRQGVAAYSFGYLATTDVGRVTVEPYDSLDQMGNPAGDANSGNDEHEDGGFASQTPAWHIVVVIRKDFITPLPRLILTERKDFTYRYERVVAYFHKADENGEL